MSKYNWHGESELTDSMLGNRYLVRVKIGRTLTEADVYTLEFLSGNQYYWQGGDDSSAYDTKDCLWMEIPE